MIERVSRWLQQRRGLVVWPRPLRVPLVSMDGGTYVDVDASRAGRCVSVHVAVPCRMLVFNFIQGRRVPKVSSFRRSR